MNRFATGAGSIVTVDCAYFSADATRLTQGNVSVDLAARLRLFGREVKLGAGWNFRATGQTADGVVSCDHPVAVLHVAAGVPQPAGRA